MLRKIGMILLVVILAFFILLFWQKDKIEKNLTALLTENQLKVEKIELKLFPVSVQLNNVEYLWVQQQRILQAQQVQLDLAGLDLLSAKLNVKKIEVQQGKSHQLAQKITDFEQLDISLFPQNSVISIFELISFDFNKFIQKQPKFNLIANGQAYKQVKFNIKSQFTLDLNRVIFSGFYSKSELAQPLINNKQVNLDFQKGSLTFNDGQYDFIAEDVQFNQIPLAKVAVKTDTKQAFINLDDKVDLYLKPKSDGYNIQLNGKNLTLAKWLEAFKIPAFIDGKTAIKAELVTDKQRLKSAAVQLNIQQGKLKNLNLLDLVSQYIPINYDESANQMDTQFHQLNSKFIWHNQHIEVSRLDIEHKYLRVAASGGVDVANNKCNFRAEVQPKIESAVNISLPINLFGNCNALEYNLEINRSFRHQLKDLIKKHWR